MPEKAPPHPAKPAKKAERHAVAVDAPIKSANLLRLRRIEGQVRGLQKMVEDDRYCPDILSQVASVQEALKGVAKELVRNHLNHCARRALKGTDAEAQTAIDELLTVWSKHT
jgi:DNA-binding FrmR family transcriptional regulator